LNTAAPKIRESPVPESQVCENMTLGSIAAETSAHREDRLWVSRLALRAYRSYEAVELNLDARPVVFFGANGAGKTNLLEALSLLAPGRGLRGSKLGDAMRRKGDGVPQAWAIAAKISQGGDEVQLRTEISASEKREVRIEGEKASPGDLGNHMRLLWLTPAMDRLFADSPGARRKFLDRMVLGLKPDHGRNAMGYEKAMRERQRILNEELDEPTWLDALEKSMAEHGREMVEARSAVVARLADAIDGANDSAFPKAVLALETGWGIDEVDFAATLKASRHRDTAAGRATLGPHRADLFVRHATKDMPAADCSTGEQKALLIGLVLANARLQAAANKGAAPLLLLDEVAAHLDEMRRAALFDEICALGAQAWMTGTDAHLFAAFGVRAQQFEVSDGKIISHARDTI